MTGPARRVALFGADGDSVHDGERYLILLTTCRAGRYGHGPSHCIVTGWDKAFGMGKGSKQAQAIFSITHDRSSNTGTTD